MSICSRSSAVKSSLSPKGSTIPVTALLGRLCGGRPFRSSGGAAAAPLSPQSAEPLRLRGPGSAAMAGPRPAGPTRRGPPRPRPPRAPRHPPITAGTANGETEPSEPAVKAPAIGQEQRTRKRCADWRGGRREGSAPQRCEGRAVTSGFER